VSDDIRSEIDAVATDRGAEIWPESARLCHELLDEVDRMALLRPTDVLGPADDEDKPGWIALEWRCPDNGLLAVTPVVNGNGLRFGADYFRVEGRRVVSRWRRADMTREEAKAMLEQTLGGRYA
jgi:hypothetical protein